MKKLIFILSVTISFNAFSQDYMEKIALQTCDCLSKIADSTDTERMYMELGVCMINASEPYKKQLKKDYNIDVNNIDKEGEALGKVVGLKMASFCPDGLFRLSKMEQNDTKEKEKESLTSIGKVTQIDRDVFVVFSVFDNSGKSMKFYWLTSVESNIDLANNYRTLVENDVRIKYYTKEFFDPKIGEYRNFNILEKLEKISR
jgi:hypothetical protein